MLLFYSFVTALLLMRGVAVANIPEDDDAAGGIVDDDNNSNLVGIKDVGDNNNSLGEDLIMDLNDYNSSSINTTSIHYSTTSIPSSNSSHGHGSHHHHAGVSLVSWRWDDYDSIFYFTLIILTASILKIGFHHTPKLAEYFPESCVLIVFGIVMGCVVDFCFEKDTHHFPKFTSTLFFNVLLPPIILDASYSMYDEDFFGNLDAILLFAVVGTIFNVFLIAFLLFAVVAAGLLTLKGEVSFLQYLVFASVIAAVDPVAVLAIFEEIHVNSVLYFLVFGESILNDGVTIVLYNTMIILSEQEQTDAAQYVLAFVSFFTVVFGGLLVGIVTGMANAVILRLTKRDHIRVLEPLVIVTSAYFSYILAEMFHWSGIISLIGCGIMQKRYAFLNASKKTYTTVKYTVKTLACVADCIIFIFLGKTAVAVAIAVSELELEFNTGFVCWSLLFCTLVRMAGVFLLSYVTNLRRMKAISFREQLILAYGGLRGAVSFSLVYILDESNPMKGIFLTTTLMVIFFTVFVQGGTIKILVDKLRIKKKKAKDKKHIFCDVNKKCTDYLMTGMETILGNISIGSYFKIIQTFDEKYIKRFLVRKRIMDRMTLRLERITLDEHYARLYGPTVLVCEESAAAVIAQDEHSSQAVGAAAGMLLLSPDRSMPRVSTGECLASLNRAFDSNPFEKFKKGQQVGDVMEGEDDFQESVLAQLRYRSLQTRDIERRLIRANSATERGTICSSSSSSEVDELLELRGGDTSCSPPEETAEEGTPMRVIRARTRSSMSAGEVRKQYLRAKRRFKSFQQ